jgi:hypothetical protein
MSNHIDNIINDVESDFDDTWETKYDDVNDSTIEEPIEDDEYFGEEYGLGEGENENEGLVNETEGFSNSQTGKQVLIAGSVLRKELQALKENEKRNEKEREIEKERREKLSNDVKKVMSLVSWASTPKTEKRKIKIRSGSKRIREFPSLQASKISTIKVQQKHHVLQPSSGKIIEKFSLFNTSYREERKRVAFSTAIENTTQEEQSLKRTKMCTSVELGTPCPHGDKCNFAHSDEELVVKNCKYGGSCHFVVYENGKIENNSHNDKICLFIHPYEEKSDYKIRITGNRILPENPKKDTEEKCMNEERFFSKKIGEVKTKIILKKGKKVQRKVEEIKEKSEIERKTPEEYKKAKEEREKRAISRFSESQRIKNEKREAQEMILNLDLNSESTAFYCSEDWNTTSSVILPPSYSSPPPPSHTSLPPPTSSHSDVIINTPLSIIVPRKIEEIKPIENVLQQTENYKSNAICRTVAIGEHCTYGNRCKFAHFLEEFDPAPCKFGHGCRFILLDDKSNTFLNNPIKDKACPFKHNGETRENYFNRVKIYNHIPKSRNVTKSVQKPLGPQIIEHKIIHKTAINSWTEPPKIETQNIEVQKIETSKTEVKPMRVIKMPKEAKCLIKKPINDTQTTYIPEQTKISPSPIETEHNITESLIEPETTPTPTPSIESPEPKLFQNVHVHLHVHLPKQNKRPIESNTTTRELDFTPETPKRTHTLENKTESFESPKIPKSPEKFIPVSSPTEKLICHRQMTRPSPRLAKQLAPLFASLPELVMNMTSPKTPQTPQTPTKPKHNSAFDDFDESVSCRLKFD